MTLGDVEFDPGVKVRHFGNTANNAFYLSLITEPLQGVENLLPIQEFGISHAISNPAWEMLDFEVKNSDWVDNPVWEDIDGSREWTDLVHQDRTTVQGLLGMRRIPRWLKGLMRKSPLGVLLFFVRIWVKRRPLISESREVSILYGPNFITSLRVSFAAGKTIFLEHGTIRWAGSKPINILDYLLKFLYRQQLRKADFLLVTNLDPETVSSVNRLFSGPWCAFPHPYVRSSLTPFARDLEMRKHLQGQTSSVNLILLGSSHSQMQSHDKGTGRALQSFKRLRDMGQSVGLVALEWGGDVQKSKEFFKENELEDFVAWIPPQPRFGLQKLASACDVSWNQFACSAIGAFDLRMIEQLVPHVSTGLSAEACDLIGGQVPWSVASDVPTIVEETISLLENMRSQSFRDELSARYLRWFEECHSSELTQNLFATVVRFLLSNQTGQSFHTDIWSRVQRGPKS